MNIISGGLKSQFFFVFFLIAFGFLVICVLKWSEIVFVNQSWSSYQANVTTRHKLIAAIHAHIGYGGLIHHFKNYVLRSEEKYYRQFIQQYDELYLLVKQYEALSEFSQKEKRALQQIMATATYYQSNLEKTKSLIEQGKSIHNIDVIVKIDDSPALKALSDLSQHFQTLSQQRQHAFEQVLRDYAVFTYGFIVLILLFVFVITYFVTNRIVTTFSQAAQLASKISQGKLNNRVHNNHCRDEAGMLLHALDTMQQKLRQYIENERCLTLENMRMNAELSVSRDLQFMVLPKPEELHCISDLKIATYFRPATEVGGDYHDILQYEGRILLSIGDVTGHGLSSGVLMMMVQTALQTLLHHKQTLELNCLMQTLNEAIYDNLQRMNSDKTLTLLLLDYDADTGNLTCCGQHEEVLILRKDGQLERFDTLNWGFFVGLVKDINQYILPETIHLNPGDTLILYTDGITEAFNGKNEIFSLERLCNLICQQPCPPPDVLIKKIIQAVNRFCGSTPLQDDITLLVAQR